MLDILNGTKSPNIAELTVGLEGEDLRIVTAAFATRGKNKGFLRSSKPYDDRDCRAGAEDALFKGCANYVWRMLSFDFIAYGPASCMPVCADFGVSWAIGGRYGDADYAEKKAKVKDVLAAMDALVKRAESNVSKDRLAGVMRWGRALGMIN